MAKKGIGILLAGGAALIFMGGKKKKKKKSSGSDAGFDADSGYDPTAEYGDSGPYSDGSTEPPPPAEEDPSRPSGNPPGGDTFDASYWGATLEDQLTNIRDHFRWLGYSNVEEGPYPMNILGPSGTVEIQNIDGSMGKLGGNDDAPSDVVAGFQSDYNKISRLNAADKIYQNKMGGLAVDGFVGPKTLNALRYAKTGLPGGKSWKPDLINQAAIKGIS